MDEFRIDLSHEQKEWRGYYPSLVNLAPTLPEFSFEPIHPGQTLTAATLQPYDALILALPCNVELSDAEIQAVRAWVTENRKGLLLLGFYTGDTHHRTNLNRLARPLGFEFAQDLVMPPNRVTDSDGHLQVFDRGGDGKYVVQVRSPGGHIGAHPLMSGVKTVGLLSCCSLDLATPALHFVLASPPGSAILRPRGERSSKGWMLKIGRWEKVGNQSLPLIAAWQADLGTVVAVGTWKLVLPELVKREGLDNAQLFRNVIKLLVQSTAPG